MGTRRTVAELDDNPTPPADPTPPASGPKKDDKLKTGEEWGDVVFPRVPFPGVEGKMKPNPGRWKHNCASALHGWREHAHHEQLPENAFRFARSAYDAAIEAAMKPVADVHIVPERHPVDTKNGTKENKARKPFKRHGYVPHEAACSPHASYMRGKKK